MHTNESVTLTRDVEASVVPVGTKVTLQKGEQAQITQSLGGSYSVIVNGNMFRIDGKDADALGFEPEAAKAADLEMLQDLITAAINGAGRKVDDAMQSTMGGMLGGMGLSGL